MLISGKQASLRAPEVLEQLENVRQDAFAGVHLSLMCLIHAGCAQMRISFPDKPCTKLVDWKPEVI